MTRQISMATRKEISAAVGQRYRHASRGEKAQILDEFVALTHYHRKYAIRLLNRVSAPHVAVRSPRNRIYDEAVRQALVVLWEAADRICGKRLRALIPLLIEAMERHGHLDVDPLIKAKLLRISAATIDRLLAPTRQQLDGQRRRRTGVGAAIRRRIPVRTFADWRDPVIPRQDSLKWIWSSIAVAPSMMATLCTAWCSPTLPPGGPNAWHCLCAIKRSSSKALPKWRPIYPFQCEGSTPITTALS